MSQAEENRRRVGRLLVSACVVLIASVSVSQPAIGAEEELSIGEALLRRYVVESPAPDFPKGGEKTCGAVVVGVVVDRSGVVQKVSPLQTPTAAAASSVTTALMHWRFDFKSATGPQWTKAGVIKSKLTFYFVQKNGKGNVFNPADAPPAEENPCPR